MAGVRVTVDKSYKKNAENVVDYTLHERYAECGNAIGEEFIRVCTPFVPLRTGELASSGHVVNTSKDEVAVAWNKSKKGFDIARRQYYNDEYAHSGRRTDHWDQAAMAYEGDTFYKRVENILNGK